jgi:transposase
MFTRISRSGGRSYLQLVESFRENGKVKQRMVASLGRLDETKVKALISDLERSIGIKSVALNKSVLDTLPISFAPARAFGDLYALQCLWQELGLGTALKSTLRSSRRQFDAEALIRTMVFNRLSDPCSKLALLDWLERVEMPGVATVTHQQLLRGMDALMDRVDEVESALTRLIKPLLDTSLSLVFYDLTTIRIHGEKELPDDLRQYGLNKETGGIARQFVLGVVQSADGIPLLHTVVPGNISEATTLRPMLERLLQRFDTARLVIVADRGLLSLDNIAQIRALALEKQRQVDFILAVSARRYKAMPTLMAELNYTEGLAETRFENERCVVAYDAQTALRQSEKRRAEIKAVEALGQKLADQLDAQDAAAEKSAAGAKSRRKGDKDNNENVRKKRSKKANDRSAYVRFAKELKDRKLTRYFTVDWEAGQFTFEQNEAAIVASEALDGKLVLLTSLSESESSRAQTVLRYKALADIERGFRVLKSDVEIAPMHHRIELRIRAHALICFLALVLHRLLRLKLKRAESDFSPTRALAELRTIQKHAVTVGSVVHAGLSTIAPIQKTLFEQLKFELPN